MTGKDFAEYFAFDAAVPPKIGARSARECSLQLAGGKRCGSRASHDGEAPRPSLVRSFGRRDQKSGTAASGMEPVLFSAQTSSSIVPDGVSCSVSSSSVRQKRTTARPLRGESAGIAHGEQHVQPGPAIRQAVALDHMQLLRMRSAEAVRPGLGVQPDRIHDEGVTFVAADQLAVIGRFQSLGMRPVQIDDARLMIVLIDDGHLVLGLQKLHGPHIAEDKGNAHGTAGGEGRRIG